MVPNAHSGPNKNPRPLQPITAGGEAPPPKKYSKHEQMAMTPEKHFSGKPVTPKTQEAENGKNANMQM
jgi:hypothetical protein